MKPANAHAVIELFNGRDRTKGTLRAALEQLALPEPENVTAAVDAATAASRNEVLRLRDELQSKSREIEKVREALATTYQNYRKACEQLKGSTTRIAGPDAFGDIPAPEPAPPTAPGEDPDYVPWAPGRAIELHCRGAVYCHRVGPPGHVFAPVCFDHGFPVFFDPFKNNVYTMDGGALLRDCVWSEDGRNWKRCGDPRKMQGVTPPLPKSPADLDCATPAATSPGTDVLVALLDKAWDLLSNVSGGAWDEQGQLWDMKAVQWEDQYTTLKRELRQPVVEGEVGK
jgi:hypothetical protein